jgi:tetratricopeptide (TPR) repeat protein
MTEQNISPQPTSTPEPHAGRVSAGVDEIIAAATALTWAARYDTARQLLDSVRPAGPDAEAETTDATGVGADEDATGTAARRLALAAAATAVHHDFRTAGPRWAPDALAGAAAVAGPQDRWQLDFLEVEHDYGCELVDENGDRRADGHDPARLAALAQRAEALVRSAPDAAGAGWAEFYRGLIGDNLLGDREGAPHWFTQALDAAEQAGDDYLAGEALRHLGDHDEEAGELASARARWERSAELWARIGNVTGVLAQQLLLAQLAIGEGSPDAGTAITVEVRRWAGAVGLVLCQKQADAMLAGRA